MTLTRIFTKTKPEELGLNLGEAKQMLQNVQQAMYFARCGTNFVFFLT